MYTVLDTGDSWFLERVVLADALEIYVVEGIKSEKPERLWVAGVDLGEAYRVDLTQTNRHFLVAFEDVLAHQITDESITTSDEYEISTKGVLGKYERSHYLDFIRSQTLIDAFRTDAYFHFRLVLADDVIDVIAEAEPSIRQLQVPAASVD